MTIRCPSQSCWNRLAVLLVAAAWAITAAGCASGKGGWFGSKKPEPPQTISSFLNQPRPK